MKTDDNSITTTINSAATTTVNSKKRKYSDKEDTNIKTTKKKKLESKKEEKERKKKEENDEKIKEGVRIALLAIMDENHMNRLTGTSKDYDHVWKINKEKTKRSNVYSCECEGKDSLHYKRKCNKRPNCMGDGWHYGYSKGRCKICEKEYRINRLKKI